MKLHNFGSVERRHELGRPRPNVQRETDLYTGVEKRLLSVKPGVTDLASIVFSDENDILKNSKDRILIIISSLDHGRVALV